MAGTIVYPAAMTPGDIQRVPNKKLPSKSSVAIYRLPGGGGFMWAVATSPDRAQDIKVQTRLDQQLPICQADPEGLQRALLNIVTNAFDAVEERQRPEVGIKTELEKGGVWVRITVLDNGPGIPPDQLLNLFKPFQSTKGARGTGLGLAVSRKILREHGGDIVAQNIDGNRG